MRPEAPEVQWNRRSGTQASEVGEPVKPWHPVELSCHILRTDPVSSVAVLYPIQPSNLPENGEPYEVRYFGHQIFCPSSAPCAVCS
jgi:hypothetical protein